MSFERLFMTQFQTIGPNCTLGEGPLWHPLRQELFWFDIPHGKLFRHNPAGGEDAVLVNTFDEPASAAGWIDRDRLVVATASGLFEFSIESGALSKLADLETDNPVTRSNDGRIGPDGSFWIGTMADNMTPKAGAYYRYHSGKVDKLFGQVSVPNATCFSPNNEFVYLTDTFRKIIWRWALDKSGAPVGEKEAHIDLRAEKLNPDGAVCDAEGYLWNAQWGAWRIARYAPDGTFDRAIDLPVSQPTCPAFGGEDFSTLYITSAKQGLTEEMLKKEPDAGKILSLEVGVKGFSEHQAVIN